MATATSIRRRKPGRDAVPLAVWPVAQTSAQYQRAGRYHPDSAAHPGKVLPALARRIVAEYSAPEALVMDPIAGVGTTLVEAAALGRRAIGIELEPKWVALARKNVNCALPPEQRSLARIRRGDARGLPALLGELTGTVDLVVVSPYACDAGIIDKPAWRSGRRLCDADSLNYSNGRTNVSHQRGQPYLASMAEIYAACHVVLRPYGLLVTVTKNTRRAGRLFDLAGTTVGLAREAGFTYLQHVIALLAAVRDGALLPRPSSWQLTQTRRARARGEPAHLVVHEDVCVFAKSEEAR